MLSAWHLFTLWSQWSPCKHSISLLMEKCCWSYMVLSHMLPWKFNTFWYTFILFLNFIHVSSSASWRQELSYPFCAAQDLVYVNVSVYASSVLSYSPTKVHALEFPVLVPTVLFRPTDCYSQMWLLIFITQSLSLMCRGGQRQSNSEWHDLLFSSTIQTVIASTQGWPLDTECWGRHIPDSLGVWPFPLALGDDHAFASA